MTALAPPEAREAAERELHDEALYVLIKRGLYWRPNGQGYTGVLDQAGRYTADEAAAHEHHGAPSTRKALASEVPRFSESCWPEIRQQTLEADIAARDADLDALRRKVAEANTTNRDLHRRAQKAESYRGRHGRGINYVLNRRLENRHARRRAEAERDALAEMAGEALADGIAWYTLAENINSVNGRLRSEITAATARATEAEALAGRTLHVLTTETTMGALLLMCGEMTAQERRTARAVANGLAAKVRSALSPADPSQSAEGAGQPQSEGQ